MISKVFTTGCRYTYVNADELAAVLAEKECVSRTFSKVYDLVGLRIGYLIARPDLAQKIRANVMAFSNVLAIHAARKPLLNNNFFQFSLHKNVETKQFIYHTLDEFSSRYVTSTTNFVFFEVVLAYEN